MRPILGGMLLGMFLSNIKQKNMNKYISIGVLVAILVFALSFVIITTFSNPQNGKNANLIITTVYSVFAFIMAGYWICCIVETFKAKKWLYGTILLVGLLLFFIIPISLRQGLFLQIGTIIFLLNMMIWGICYVKYRELFFLILIGGWLIFLLALPYCEILFD